MKNVFPVASTAAALTVAFALSSCTTQEEKIAKPAAPPAAPPAKTETQTATKTEAPTEAKKEAKAKVEKAKGDVGLIDTEKNYMILVTKDGKLITLDFDAKTKATQITPTPSKISDIGLGSSATVVYTKQGEKNVASALEYTPAKGGD